MGEATCNCPHRKTPFCVFPNCPSPKRSRRRDFSKTNDTRGYRTIGHVKKYYRSKWEANFARVLQWHKVTQNPFDGLYIRSWEHEPQKLWFTPDQAQKAVQWWKANGKKKTLKGIKSGTNSVLLDFRVKGIRKDYDLKSRELLFPNLEVTKWYEVKGYFERKDFTKKARVSLYHPWIDLAFIDAQWFKMNRVYRSLIPEWE